MTASETHPTFVSPIGAEPVARGLWAGVGGAWRRTIRGSGAVVEAAAVPPPALWQDPSRRHLFALAHQDDELGYIGLMRRLRANAHFLYLTNGDGVAPEAGMEPEPYGKLRVAECDAALRAAGLGDVPKTDLWVSEIAIYDHFNEVSAGGARREAAIRDFFLPLYARVSAVVETLDPEVMWTCAYQGGHPEHDLIAAMVILTARRLAARRGTPVPVVFFPEYEFTILVPLRFKPWYGGPVWRIRLNEDELLAKRGVVDSYPSQRGLFDQFERVIDRMGRISGWLGMGAFKAADFLGTETFGPIDPGFDLLANPHTLDIENYMFERHNNVAVTWAQSIAPIVAALIAHDTARAAA